MTRPTGEFGPGQPSRTSLLVAAGRAFGAREPDQSVRNPDWLAERLLGPEELDLIAGHPIAAALSQDYESARQNLTVAGLSNLMLVRTRFIDERLEKALKDGAAQVVILGAGFDTRAYRFQDLLAGRNVFEVDYHSTQDLKKRRVQDALGSLPAHVVYVEIDFKREALLDVLRRVGYQPGEQTFFIWEGVSMYLPEASVRETLRAIASGSAPGSRLVMDFVGRISIQALEKFPNHPQREFTDAWGEPWVFGLPDGQERQFFDECGLELCGIFPFTNRKIRPYMMRENGTRLGPSRREAMQAAARERRRRPRSGSRLKSLWKALPFIWKMLARRATWYAMAELRVPQR
jgi:methyltransferase (TIGR00027 family)